MREIHCVIDHREGTLDDSAWELRAAARAVAGGEEVRVVALLLGEDLAGPGAALAGGGYDAVRVFEDPGLAVPDGETYAETLAPFLSRERPFLTLLAHTNLAIDLAPGLAARLGVPLLPDCLSLELADGQLRAVRVLYGGKVHARFRAAPCERGSVATVRGGAYAAAPAPSASPGEVQAAEVPAELPARRRHVRTVAPDPGEVDISQAELLVGVGRGIEEEENLELVRTLAAALGAEVACSRPVVDKGWLPKSRQVGTSGVTVKPRLYVAVGISGSFQHVGGIKGSPYLVAINKDARAPIFGVADVGIVGDLFDVVPALEAGIRAAKG